MTDLPSFDMAGLAQAVEALTIAEIDQLPFGVVKLDDRGVVRIYNRTEAERSGRGGMPTVGLEFFTDIAPCMDNGYYKGRIEKARAAGKLDISFEFIGDFADRNRELAVRVQSSHDGGVWIFTKIAVGAS